MDISKTVTSHKPVVKILFDESHGEYWESGINVWKQKQEHPHQSQNSEDVTTEQNSSPADSAIASAEYADGNYTQLLKLLNEHEFDTYSDHKKGLNKKVLERTDVLVLGAPTQSFKAETIETIYKFVEQGGGLLIVHDYRSLFAYERSRYEQSQASDPFRQLLAMFGIRMKRLLSYPPEEVTHFSPHYLSAGVDRIFTREPVYLEKLEDLSPPLKDEPPPRIIAQLPKPSHPFLMAVEVKYGRVVAIADYAMFGDDYIAYGSNCQFARNVFQWLGKQNDLDCIDATIQSTCYPEQTVDFSIKLHNPQSQRLEYIHCLLEANAEVEIQQPEQTVRSIPPYGSATLGWRVQPRQLGNHILKLVIDFPRHSNQTPLFFDQAAQFKCVSDAAIGLAIRNHQGDFSGDLETNQPFEIQAVLGRSENTALPGLKMDLESSSTIQVESIETPGSYRWRLNASQDGDASVTLVIKETEQRLSLPIRVQPSPQEQIATLEREVMGPIASELHYRLSQLYPDLASDSMEQIPCHLYTPEEFVHTLKSPPESELLLEALEVARAEDQKNRPLVLYLLEQIAPTFSPIHGCCIPYDPKLATHLNQKHSQYEDNLAQNFLALEHHDRDWIQQSLAALIVHEKYGHGFFFAQTTLGQQLTILYKHGLTRNANLLQLKSPYLRALYKKYKSAIQAIWDSSIIVNEGFATWLELTVLPLCSGGVKERPYRRRDFLFNHDHSLARLAQLSPYFKKFPPSHSSRYRQGCEYLQEIQKIFQKQAPDDCGFYCAVQVLVKAADIDLGISEVNGQVQFALGAKALKKQLLKRPQDDARADRRLHRIHSHLQNERDFLSTQQKSLDLLQKKKYHEVLISEIVYKALGL